MDEATKQTIAAMIPKVIISGSGMVMAPKPPPPTPYDKFKTCDLVQIVWSFFGIAVWNTYGMIIDRGHGLFYLARIRGAKLVVDELHKYISKWLGYSVNVVYRHPGLAENVSFSNQINDFVLYAHATGVKGKSSCENWIKSGPGVFAKNVFERFGINLNFGGK